ALATARRIKAEVSTEGGFASAVARYSGAASKARGGRLDWMELANLPGAIAPYVLGLNPGEVSDALSIPGGVAVFQLRAIEELKNPDPTPIAVEYATYLVPNDGNADAELARVRGAVDACPALFAEAMGLPESQLTRVMQKMAEVPTDIALELAQMDPGESTTDLMRGGNRVLLMLCSRQPGVEPPLDRDGVRKELLNRRLGAQADLYLAELQANAIIRQP
ncbi:MAG: peptidylprolyl isomerase, partial [Rhodoferax sp.]